MNLLSVFVASLALLWRASAVPETTTGSVSLPAQNRDGSLLPGNPDGKSDTGEDYAPDHTITTASHFSHWKKKSLPPKKRLPRKLIWVRSTSPAPATTPPTTKPTPAPRFAYLDGFRDTFESRRRAQLRPHEYHDFRSPMYEPKSQEEAVRMSLFEYLLALLGPSPSSPSMAKPPSGGDDGSDYVDDTIVSDDDNYYDADEKWVKELMEASPTGEGIDLLDGEVDEGGITLPLDGKDGQKPEEKPEESEEKPEESVEEPDDDKPEEESKESKPEDSKPETRQPVDNEVDSPKQSDDTPATAKLEATKTAAPSVASKTNDDAKSHITDDHVSKTTGQKSDEVTSSETEAHLARKEMEDSVALLRKVFNGNPTLLQDEKSNNDLYRQAFPALGMSGMSGLNGLGILVDPMFIFNALYRGVSSASAQLVDVALNDPAFQASLQAAKEKNKQQVPKKKNKQQVPKKTNEQQVPKKTNKQQTPKDNGRGQRWESFEENNELNLKFKDNAELMLREMGQDIDSNQTSEKNSVKNSVKNALKNSVAFTKRKEVPSKLMEHLATTSKQLNKQSQSSDKSSKVSQPEKSTVSGQKTTGSAYQEVEETTVDMKRKELSGESSTSRDEYPILSSTSALKKHTAPSFSMSEINTESTLKS